MSTLENIRKRPAITIGIIGFALVLFLFTGINGCDRLVGGDRDTAAKVDGEKIKYDELRIAADNAADNYKQQYGTTPDANLNAEQTLNSLIDSKLIGKEIDRLGIKATDTEIADLIYGPTALPYFTNMARQYGFNSMDELYQFAKSGEQGSEMAQMIIDNAVAMLREQLPQQKFQSLLGAINVNKLDAKAYYDAASSTATLYVARQDLNTIADDQVNVSDDEIRARYNDTKSRYAIPEQLTIADYILVDVVPSSEDRLAAQQEVEAVIPQLKEQPGLEAIGGNYNFTSNTVTGTADKISDNQIKNNLDKIIEESVVLISAGENYTLAKLLSTAKKSEKASVEVLAVAADADADALVKSLNEGTPVADLKELTPAATEAIEIDMINDPASATFADKETGKYFTFADPASGTPMIAAVKSYSEPVTVYEIAKIQRPVEASDATYGNQLEQLTAYIAANPAAADFKANATESNFNVLQTSIAPSNLSVLGRPSTGAAAKWATEAKKGQVSDVFTDDAHSYLLVLAVNDRYSDFVPVSDPGVANDIRLRLTAEKKADKLVADLNGKASDVDSYAAIMKVTPETVTANYGSEYVRGFIPGDPALLAAIAKAKKGDFVGPLATRNSVVVFTVNDIENSGREFDFDTDRRTAMQRQPASVLRNISNILRANKKIDYNVQRFYSGN